MKYTVRPVSDRTAFTGKPRRSAFDSTWGSTLDLLFREVEQLKGRDLVIELDVTERHIRNDGTLYANARPTSPAVRVAFDSEHGPLTYATDRFTTWQDNVRAIALALEALRKVDRYGITKRGEQYTGFRALPSGGPSPAADMTVHQARHILLSFSSWEDWDAWDDATAMRKLYKSARAATHPDRNEGDQKHWDQVEQAARVLGVTQ